LVEVRFRGERGEFVHNLRIPFERGKEEGLVRIVRDSGCRGRGKVCDEDIPLRPRGGEKKEKEEKGQVEGKDDFALAGGKRKKKAKNGSALEPVPCREKKERGRGGPPKGGKVKEL